VNKPLAWKLYSTIVEKNDENNVTMRKKGWMSTSGVEREQD
jgi:hypothetical protein